MKHKPRKIVFQYSKKRMDKMFEKLTIEFKQYLKNSISLYNQF